MLRKKIYRLMSLVLSGVLFVSSATTVFAETQKTNSQELEAGAVQIGWSELPEEYKEIIDRSAVIYKNDDGTYDIFQDKSVNSKINALERYAPDGGTYSNFSNSSYGGSTIVRLVYQTYMPANKVGKYLVQNKSTVYESAVQWVAAYGITETLTLLASRYGIKISSNALNLAVSSAIVYYSSYNYNQMLTVSGGGQYGVQIDYITTIGAGNSRVYSKWGSAPYVLSLPNGGSATWAPGEYYAQP